MRIQGRCTRSSEKMPLKISLLDRMMANNLIVNVATWKSSIHNPLVSIIKYYIFVSVM